MITYSTSCLILGVKRLCLDVLPSTFFEAIVNRLFGLVLFYCMVSKNVNLQHGHYEVKLSIFDVPGTMPHYE